MHLTETEENAAYCATNKSFWTRTSSHPLKEQAEKPLSMNMLVWNNARRDNVCD